DESEHAAVGRKGQLRHAVYGLVKKCISAKIDAQVLWHREWRDLPRTPQYDCQNERDGQRGGDRPCQPLVNAGSDARPDLRRGIGSWKCLRLVDLEACVGHV